MQQYRLSNYQWRKWVRNTIVFTAPALAVFFLQLASGVDIKAAAMVALLAFYGLMADYFKKLKK